MLGTLGREPEVGVVLIEEDLHAALPAPLRRELARRVLPLIVPFPAPRWAEMPEAEAFVAELLRQAIGYRVRLG
jgi:vacuolar-type H+-ATPase subunit F/Vma7